MFEVRALSHFQMGRNPSRREKSVAVEVERKPDDIEIAVFV
jgi:hypothetical protein